MLIGGTRIRGQDDGRAWGKTPVRVLDTPGFIVNRVARPFYLETFRMLEEGVAPIEVIDAALEGAGFRMAPGRLLDLIGIDVNWAVTRAVYEGFGRAPRFEPHRLQQRMVDEGRLGRKSGRGFYDYAPDAPGSPARAAEVDRALAASVVDQDTADPPDATAAASFVSSFTTAAVPCAA